MYTLLHLVLLCTTFFAYYQSFALPDTKLIKDSLEKKNRTLNIRVLFSNDKTKEILTGFESRRNTAAFTARTEKENEFYRILKHQADVSQKKTMDALQTLLNNRDPKTNEASMDQMWMLNQLFVWKADTEIVDLLGQMEDVASIEEDQVFELDKLPEPKPLQDKQLLLQRQVGVWGISKMQVRESMLGANKGKGAVVGIIDTGVLGSHESIKKQFRSDHGWYDAEKKEKRPDPIDLIGHGTSVTSIILGSGVIGVAPEAQWIACRGVNTGVPDAIASMLVDQCMQWMTCPTDRDGKSSVDCRKRPHVVNCSFNWPLKARGLTRFITERLKAWRINNIVAVFSNGNLGNECNTVAPPAEEEYAISVGATNIRGEIWSKSSAGPGEILLFNGEKKFIIKPNVVAPGDDIPCAFINDDSSYRLESGTSLAAPHVTGLAALYFSHKPHATVDEFKRDLFKGGVTSVRGPGMDCNGNEEFRYPNNHAGYGIVNAMRLSRYIERMERTKNGDTQSVYQPSLSLYLILTHGYILFLVEFSNL